MLISEALKARDKQQIECVRKSNSDLALSALRRHSYFVPGAVRQTITYRALVVMQFDVARASCACLHGRDARATLKLHRYRIWKVGRTIPAKLMFSRGGRGFLLVKRNLLCDKRNLVQGKRNLVWDKGNLVCQGQPSSVTDEVPYEANETSSVTNQAPYGAN